MSSAGAVLKPRAQSAHIGWSVEIVEYEAAVCAYAARIAIPHNTTANALMKQAAVKAISKADEAIAMLSFAYPGHTSM